MSSHLGFARQSACALGAMLLAFTSPRALAAPGHSAVAYSTGSFIYTDPTLPPNTVFGNLSQLPDGSVISHMGCVPAVQGGVGCSTNGLPIVVDTWYKRPHLATLAAAQAFADYGLLKARSWRTLGISGGIAPGEPLGHRSYFAEATTEWSEDLIYAGTMPTLVTMQFTLHASWNDLGRFGFTIGRETFGPENVRLIDGLQYINCAGAIECQNTGLAQTMQVLGNDAANTSGNVTLAINYSFLLSKPVVDPENPNPPPPFTFVASLMTSSTAPGAEADAFNTVTLDRILVEPGVQITFGSGHDWPVQVVPEPGSAWLWLAGLAAVAPVARRRRAGC